MSLCGAVVQALTCRRDTLYAARMARGLLWENERDIATEDFVAVSQTCVAHLCAWVELTAVSRLVDLFSDQELTPSAKAVRRNLLSYYSLLQSTHLSNSVLSSLPLPRTLDPNTPATIPGRLYTVMILVRDTLAALLPLPFFFIPLVVHAPVYIMGSLGARLVEHEEETQAQNKVAFGLLSLLLIYPATFFFLWALFFYTRIGAIFAALIVYLFAVYHIKMIDGEAACYFKIQAKSDRMTHSCRQLRAVGAMYTYWGASLTVLQGEAVHRGVARAGGGVDAEAPGHVGVGGRAVHKAKDAAAQRVDRQARSAGNYGFPAAARAAGEGALRAATCVPAADPPCAARARGGGECAGGVPG